MTPDTKLEKGDIVQMNPTTTRSKAFAACLAIVDEPKAFGAQVYVQGLGEKLDQMGGQAYYRARWEEMELTGGKAPWLTD